MSLRRAASERWRRDVVAMPLVAVMGEWLLGTTRRNAPCFAWGVVS
jgi:hypothetical protein